MVYGTTFCLPGEFFINNTDSEPQSEFVKNLSTAMRKIQPSETAHHSPKKPFICNELLSSVYVFVRFDAVRHIYSIKSYMMAHLKSEMINFLQLNKQKH